MILVYCHKTTPRLTFVLDELIKRRLGAAYRITHDVVEAESYRDAVINYSLAPIANSIRIVPVALLFEDIISEQLITVTEEKWWLHKFYASSGDIPFDVFAASFYLLSRYEEYLPHQKDKHERYLHTESLAYRSGFLHLPLVDIWVLQLRWHLENKCHYTKFNAPEFKTLSTIDIDFAYRYRGIGFIRYWLKLGKSLIRANLRSVFEQLRVGVEYKHDPYDTFDWIEKITDENKIELMYFVLLSNGTPYDKNIIPHHPVMVNLLKKLASKYIIGLHPSYFTSDNDDLLLHEKEFFESYVHQSVEHTRQHFLRYHLPQTFEMLNNMGVLHDYSVGYANASGFRASTSHAFHFFDLATNQTKTLLLHPISVMDITYKNNADYTPGKAALEIERIMGEVKKVNGTFISIWHNSNLSIHEGWLPWKEVFQKMHTLAASKEQQEID